MPLSSIGSKIIQLAIGLRDLSQAEKEMCPISKTGQIHKMVLALWVLDKKNAILSKNSIGNYFLYFLLFVCKSFFFRSRYFKSSNRQLYIICKSKCRVPW